MIFYDKGLDATLYEKDVMKLRFGEWKFILDYLSCPKIQSHATLKERQREFGDRPQGRRGSRVTTGAEIGMMQPQNKNTWRHQMLEEARNRFPQGHPQGVHICWHLDFG